jgi:hypothetical protein
MVVRIVVVGSSSCRKLFEVEQMSNSFKFDSGFSLNENEMKAGYEEMGMLNVSLSEEGLDRDRKDLESYEKFLVESE